MQHVRLAHKSKITYLLFYSYTKYAKLRHCTVSTRHVCHISNYSLTHVSPSL